jgi:hypothetical protein
MFARQQFRVPSSTIPIGRRLTTGGPDKPVKRVRLKKKYEELPTCLLLPDGSVAKPLELLSDPSTLSLHFGKCELEIKVI